MDAGACLLQAKKDDQLGTTQGCGMIRMDHSNLFGFKIRAISSQSQKTSHEFLFDNGPD
jgi:hypothetical protein